MIKFYLSAGEPAYLSPVKGGITVVNKKHHYFCKHQSSFKSKCLEIVFFLNNHFKLCVY